MWSLHLDNFDSVYNSTKDDQRDFNKIMAIIWLSFALNGIKLVGMMHILNWDKCYITLTHTHTGHLPTK